MAVVDIEIHDDQTDTENSVGPPSVSDSERLSDVHICGKLNKEQSEEIAQLLHEFADVMTDKPGCTI